MVQVTWLGIPSPPERTGRQTRLSVRATRTGNLDACSTFQPGSLIVISRAFTTIIFPFSCYVVDFRNTILYLCSVTHFCNVIPRRYGGKGLKWLDNRFLEGASSEQRVRLAWWRSQDARHRAGLLPRALRLRLRRQLRHRQAQRLRQLRWLALRTRSPFPWAPSPAAVSTP